LEPGFFVARDKKKLGPFSWGQLQEMAGSGQLGPAEMILPPSSGKWVAASSVSGLFPAPPSALAAPAAAPAPRSEENARRAGNGDAEADLSEALSLSASDRLALGRWRSCHPTGSRMHKIGIGIAAVFTLVLGGAAVAALVALLTGPPGNGWGIGVGLFGALALLPGIALFFLIRRLRWRVFLFDKGFVLVKGGERVVLWTDVKSVFRGGTRLEPKLWLTLEDGGRITLDSAFQGFSALSATAEENVAGLVLAKGAAALSRGEAVSFGKMTLSKEGLENEGKPLAWPDVDNLAIEWRRSGNVVYTALVVFKKTSRGKAEWCAKRLDAFPNFKAFLHLAGRFTTIEAKDL
jgi:hypothetical protein